MYFMYIYYTNDNSISHMYDNLIIITLSCILTIKRTKHINADRDYNIDRRHIIDSKQQSYSSSSSVIVGDDSNRINAISAPARMARVNMNTTINRNSNNMIVNESKYNNHDNQSTDLLNIVSGYDDDDDDEEVYRTRAIPQRSSQYLHYIESLQTQRLTVFPVSGDGNCLFRAVAHQIYGDERYHMLVREKCMDYMEVEADFFSQFVIGGKAMFAQYIHAKRSDACWGDDPEIEVVAYILYILYLYYILM